MENVIKYMNMFIKHSISTDIMFIDVLLLKIQKGQ